MTDTLPPPAPTATAVPPGTVADSEPYPWPWDGRIDLGRLALVVTGWDADWAARCDPDGAMMQRIVDLAAATPFVVTVSHPTLPTSATRPPGDWARPHDGAPPRAALPPLAGATAVTAAGVDAFYGGPLDATLRAARRDQLLLVGLGLEGPVHSTMRSANDRGLECLLVLDACAPLDPALVPAARSMVLMSGGIFGAVGAAAAVLDAIAAVAPTGPDAPGGAR